MKPLVIVGDALLDRDLVGPATRLAPDAPVPVIDDPVAEPRPGGAGLAALLARRDGRDVVLVTALGRDAAGRELRELLERAGVELIDLGLDGRTPEKVRVRSAGHSLLRLDYGGPPGAVGPADRGVQRALVGAGAILVSDYGRGVAQRVGPLPSRVPTVWDPHPRGGPPRAGVLLATPNAGEAAHFTGPSTDPPDHGLAGWAARARRLRRDWQVGGVAVTLGARGALYLGDDSSPPLAVPAVEITTADPCGAGDRFAVAAAGRLADGALPSEAVVAAVDAASAFLASGGAAAARPAPARAPAGPRDAEETIRRVRSAGGTVVATGGCFDLLHAGHVSLLEAARRLGDCLIVLVNSDASVRRIKGPSRPLVCQDDRTAVLAALECVDAVVVFDEDTPAAALDRIRPDIWAKGGDYALAELPETEVLARFGGQPVVLPYLPGRSTTALVEEAARRG